MRLFVGALTSLTLFAAAYNIASGQFAPGQIASEQRGNTLEQRAREVFQQRDRNGDHRLSRREYPRPHPFDEVDANKDGSVTLKEDIAFRRAHLKRAFEQSRQRQTPLPEGTVVHRDLVYAKIGERELPLDLYTPKSDSRLPVIMWVHGGGWKGGGKGNAGSARLLVDHGYAVVDVEYRLSGEAIFPAQIQDCKAAVRWIRANATKYKLDPDRIGVWGSSAGGHLVALMGTSGDVAEFETKSNAEFSSRVQAVCDWFGPTDLLKMNEHAIPLSKLDHNAAASPESRLVGGPIQQEPYRSLAKKANPINYIDKDAPPFLIVHGDQDKLVSHRQSELLHDALVKLAVDSTLQIEKGAGHGFGGGSASRDELAKQASKFFDRHFKMPLKRKTTAQ